MSELSEDWEKELAQLVEQERLAWVRALDEHEPDPVEKGRIEAFCERMMERGEREEASAWLASPEHVLGEMTHEESVELVQKLTALGCTAIHVCEIDVYDGDEANSGALVIELPLDRAQRKAILIELDRRARTGGYGGNLDEGQRFEFVKLD